MINGRSIGKFNEAITVNFGPLPRNEFLLIIPIELSARVQSSSFIEPSERA